MRVGTGEAKGKKLKSPTSTGTRPIIQRVKLALFNILSTDVEDAYILDLFAGVGGVGIEALSRGAAFATFIELNPKIMKIVRENLQLTGLSDRAETLQQNAFTFLQTHEKLPTLPEKRQYDIIYIAPPQYQEMAAKALEAVDRTPMLKADGQAIVQIHPKERPGVAAVELQRLELTDERKYGSTLLMFYRPREVAE